nr:hypothetical protein [Clostridium sp. AM45-5]
MTGGQLKEKRGGMVLGERYRLLLFTRNWDRFQVTDRMGNRESCFVLWVSGLPEQKDMKKPCTSRTGIHHLGFQFQKGLG